MLGGEQSIMTCDNVHLNVNRFPESIASLCQSRNPGEGCENAMKPNYKSPNDKFQLGGQDCDKDSAA